MTSVETSERSETKVAEKGTLPDAPLAMPRQVLEAPEGGSFLRFLAPRASRAGH